MRPHFLGDSSAGYQQRWARALPYSPSAGATMRGVILLLLLLILVRTAWIAEDSFITYRIVDNFLGGYGLRWNVAERVYVFTSPLWALLLAAASRFTGELLLTSMFVSVVITLAATAIVLRIGAERLPALLLGGAPLLLSKSFTDFATPGLENPLSFLVVALFVRHFLRIQHWQPRDLFWLSFLPSLGVLVRHDLILLFLPALLFVLRQRRRGRALTAAFLGWLPLVIWEMFSLVYFGFLFPGVAYAKLGHGVPQLEILWQGVRYFLSSVSLDPITPGVLLLSAVLVVLVRRGRLLMLVGGIYLYLLYVWYVGGDFMSGRFLSVPFFMAVAVLVYVARSLAWPVIAPLIGFVAVLGFLSPRSPLLSNQDYAARSEVREVPFGIADERGYYYGATGLLNLDLGASSPVNHEWVRVGEALRRSPGVAVHGATGMIGYYAGPAAHIIDPFGLSDALLARLPATRERYDIYTHDYWRIGHFMRKVPAGYVQTWETGRNSIVDPALAAYYDRLVLLTQGRLWDAARWREIVRFNFGVNDRAIPTTYP